LWPKIQVCGQRSGRTGQKFRDLRQCWNLSGEVGSCGHKSGSTNQKFRSLGEDWDLWPKIQICGQRSGGTGQKSQDLRECWNLSGEVESCGQKSGSTDQKFRSLREDWDLWSKIQICGQRSGGTGQKSQDLREYWNLSGEVESCGHKSGSTDQKFRPLREDWDLWPKIQICGQRSGGDRPEVLNSPTSTRYRQNAYSSSESLFASSKRAPAGFACEARTAPAGVSLRWRKESRTWESGRCPAYGRPTVVGVDDSTIPGALIVSPPFRDGVCGKWLMCCGLDGHERHAVFFSDL